MICLQMLRMHASTVKIVKKEKESLRAFFFIRERKCVLC